MTFAPNIKEMIDYAELLKEGFNPSSVEDLHALLYLIYYDYKYNNFADPNFSTNLMNLVEQCKTVYTMNESQNCIIPRPNDNEPCNCSSLPLNRNGDSILEFVQFGVRNLFYDEEGHRIPVDIFGREMRRM